MTKAPLLRLRRVRREYASADGVFAALKSVDLDIFAGEMIAIIGASGSGKSTLMNILGCLDRPTSSNYAVGGRDTGRLECDELAALRREHFGFIFQRYHLLSDLSARGNVEIPAIYAGSPRTVREHRAHELLARLGLAERMTHRPGQLSGGQQQRVSIARALMNGGTVILADEPTGALDSASGAEVMQVLKELHAEGHAVILVTHDAEVAAYASRIIEIRDGSIVDDRQTHGPARAIADSTPAAPAQSRSNSWQQSLDRFSSISMPPTPRPMPKSWKSTPLTKTAITITAAPPFMPASSAAILPPYLGNRIGPHVTLVGCRYGSW